MNRSHALSKTSVTAPNEQPSMPEPGKRTLTQDLEGPSKEDEAIKALEAATASLLRLRKAKGPDARAIAVVVMTDLNIARSLLNECTGVAAELEERYLRLIMIADLEYQRISLVPPHPQTSKQTGIPDVDQTALCERLDAPREGCWMSPGQRAELVQRLIYRMIVAYGNFKLALESAKLATRFTKHSQYGFFAEMLFGLVSHTLLGGLMSVYARWKSAAEEAILLGEGALTVKASLLQQIVTRVPQEKVKGVFVMLAHSTRSGIKERMHSSPGESTGHVDFLTLMQREIDLEHQVMREKLASTLTDDELVLMTEAYDIRKHDQATYEQQIDTLLARYDEHEIDLIGARRAVCGRVDVVRFACKGQERYAEFQQDSRFTYNKKKGDRFMTTLEGASFLRWIDEDFVSVAVAQHQERIGDLLTVDVSDGRSEFVPVLLWAAQTLEQERRP